MSGPLDALPERWRAHRLVQSDLRRALTRPGVHWFGDDDALVVLTPTSKGVHVAGAGVDGGAGRIVADLVARGDLAAPLVWMSLPRSSDLPPALCDALSVEPLAGWDLMSTDTIHDVPGTAHVTRLDVARDLPAILDCLAEGNPVTDADPAGPDEAAWWGVREGVRLVGAMGAQLRGGASDEGFSWHLHGLGVRPGARRGGLGTALLVAATRDGLAAGADFVSLGVWADNEPALRIYRRLGFRTDHEGRSYRPV